MGMSARERNRIESRGGCEIRPFRGDRKTVPVTGAGDIAAQLLEFVTLIHGAAHFGAEAESLCVGTELLGRLRIKASTRRPPGAILQPHRGWPRK